MNYRQVYVIKMGTIFKYNNKLIQCRNLTKKLKKMHLQDSDIFIVLDNIPNDVLEQTFVEMVNDKKIEEPEDEKIGNPYFYWNPVNNHTTGIGYGIPSNPPYWTKDWVLIEGIPKYPIELKDGKPCLEN